MKQNNLIQLLIAAVISLAGIALLFVGTLLAPQGEIHETILVAFGEIATFAGSIIGIDYRYKMKDERGKMKDLNTNENDHPHTPKTKPSKPSRSRDDNHSAGTRITPLSDA